MMQQYFESFIGAATILMAVLIATGILVPLKITDDIILLDNRFFAVAEEYTFSNTPKSVRFSILSNCTVNTLSLFRGHQRCFRNMCAGEIYNVPQTVILAAPSTCAYSGIIRFMASKTGQVGLKTP